MSTVYQIVIFMVSVYFIQTDRLELFVLVPSKKFEAGYSVRVDAAQPAATRLCNTPARKMGAMAAGSGTLCNAMLESRHRRHGVIHVNAFAHLAGDCVYNEARVARAPARQTQPEILNRTHGFWYGR